MRTFILEDKSFNVVGPMGCRSCASARSEAFRRHLVRAKLAYPHLRMPIGQRIVEAQTEDDFFSDFL